MCWWSTCCLTCLQGIEEIPADLKQLYKTVWEISQKTVIKMAADRGAYIDQSQSLNIHIAEPNYGKLTSMHFYGWQLVSQDWGNTQCSSQCQETNVLMPSSSLCRVWKPACTTCGRSLPPTPSSSPWTRRSWGRPRRARARKRRSERKTWLPWCAP